MGALAKRWLIIIGIIVGVLSGVGVTVGVLLNQSPNVVARSDRLETPMIKSVEKEEDHYLLSFDYIAEATGYRVTEYDEVNDERHTQTYSGDQVIYAGDYVKVDITSFLFATHTEADFKQYKFTVLAKFSDAVFNSKESAVFTYDNKISLKSPTIEEIDPNSTMVRWDMIEYATSYDVYLNDELQNRKFINTTETYVTFDAIKTKFGEQSAYKLSVVAKNADVTKQGFILNSDESEQQIYVPNGQLESAVLSYNGETKVLSWSPVVGADYYNVYINTFGVTPFINSKESKSAFNITANNVSINLSDVDYISYLGTIEIYVEAVSNNANITPSESNSIAFINKRQLTAPTNIQIVSDANYLKVSWEPATDANFANGYSVVFFLYTEEQASSNNYITNPQLYNEVTRSGHTSSICEFTLPIAVNPTGYFGVGVKTTSVPGSQFEDSEFAYYKDSVNNKNLYNAKKVLQNPDGIVATENEDGTISVSWNTVENARRYHVRVTNELGQHEYFAVVDKRTEFNRVNTRIPPEVINNNINLEPGKYTIAVGTESEGSSYVAIGGYNDSVNYPNGQNYVAYRTVYDLTDLNLSFNLTSKNLSWSSVADAETYDVYVNGEKVGTTQECEYNLTSYFEDLSHDTGAYQISVMVKSTPTNFHIDTLSTYQVFDFIQKYAAPTNVNVAYDAQNTNLATLTWQASANATAQTSYLVVVNGAEQPLTTQTQMDVTNLLQVGANVISVQAVEDATHFASLTQPVTDGSNVYNYTLSAIEGDITVTAEAVNGDYPNVSLSFAPVKNAQGYNVSINDGAEVTYSATITNGVATITFSQADIANLTPFQISEISVTPSKGTNDNILLPATSISKVASFKNVYFIPQIQTLEFETVYMPSNIISYYDIDARRIYVRFSPIVLENEVSENNFEQLVVTSYVGKVINASTQAVLSEFEFTIDGNNVNTLTVHLFEPFKATETLFFSGELRIVLAGKIDSLVGLSKTSTNTLTISKVLEQAENINYVENEDGMILSWKAVTDATSYDVLDDTNSVIATISSADLEQHVSAGIVSVDLTSELYSKDVGTYTVKIVAKLGSLTSETTTQIQVEKKIKIFDYKLVQNNTKLQIAEQDFPRTAVVPTDVNDTQIYATHLMLVFDSRDGAELLATTELSDGYTRKLVALTPNSDIEVNLMAYHNAQTCYAYAFNSDLTKSSISEIVEIDLTGVIKYSQPTINFSTTSYLENPSDLEEVSNLEVGWNVEFLPFEDGMKTSNFSFDLTIADGSILQSLITNNNIEFVAYDRDGNVINGILSYNEMIIVDQINPNYANLKTIVAIIKNQPAGLYTAKVQAKTVSIVYANDSSISEASDVFVKTITFPHKRVVVSTAVDQTTNLNTIENVNINSQSFNLYLGTYVYDSQDPTNNAIAYDTVDGINLTTFRMVVVETDSTYVNEYEVVSEKTYKLALDNDYGYYFVLDRASLGIHEVITSSNPKYYVVLIKYATPNAALFDENDWFAALELQITECTPETIQDIEFFEDEDEFEIDWLLVDGTNVCYNLYVTEHGQTTQLNVSGVSELSNELSPSAIDSVLVTKSDIENYSESTVYDVYFKVWDSTQSEPTDYMKFFINSPSGFEYNKVSNELTIKTNNNVPYDNITQVSLNGYIFDIVGAAYTENSITFSSARVGVIEAIRQTLDEDRDVFVVVYKNSDVVFEGSASTFPVFVSAYASNIKVVVDELTWDSVEFVAEYEVYDSTNAKLSDGITLTTNSVLMDALFTTGGEYSVYVASVVDATAESNNVFSDGSTDKGITSVIYNKPYNTISNLAYINTFDEQTYQYKKVITFTDENDILELADSNKVYTIKVSGEENLQFTATLKDANKGGDVEFEVSGGVYSIDISEQLNSIIVGNYTISVKVAGLTGNYRTDSKNSTINIENRKIISIPTEDFDYYFTITPDQYFAPLQANMLQNYLTNFNAKSFTLNHELDYATILRISVLGTDVAVNNEQGAVSEFATVSQKSCNVVVRVEIASNAVGNMSFYDIPPAAFLQANGFVATKVGDASTLSRTYENVEFLVANATPTYGEIQYTEPADGETGANQLSLAITNPVAGTYRVYFYDDPADVDLFGLENVKTYADVELDAENEFDFVEAIKNAIIETKGLETTYASANMSFVSKYFTVAKLLNANDETFNLPSFQGDCKSFDYHYILGSIENCEYDEQTYQIAFDLLDVEDDIASVKYHVTLYDLSDNTREYACIVEYDDQNGYFVSENNSALIKQLFTISEGRLLFNITNFTNDKTRTGFYLVGQYSFDVWAGDETTLSPEAFGSLNIKSSAKTEKFNFIYNIQFPLEIVSASYASNLITWQYIDDSGLDLDLSASWQYKLGSNSWATLKDVSAPEVVNDQTGTKQVSAKILFNYSELYNANGTPKDLQIRINVNGFLENAGEDVEIAGIPQLPQLTTVLDSDSAQDITFVFNFDNTGMNRSQKTWFKVGKTLEENLNPIIELTIQKLGEGNSVEFSTTITIESEELSDWYKNGDGTIKNFVKLFIFDSSAINDATKEALIVIKNGTYEFKPGTYNLIAVLKNADETAEHSSTFYASSTAENQVVVLPRWQTQNVEINSGDTTTIDGKVEDAHITYYGNLIFNNKGEVIDKRYSYQKSKNWADGLLNSRDTILSFDITNVFEGANAADYAVFARLITLSEANGMETVNTEGRQLQAYPTTITENATGWHVVANLTSIWATVGSPKEYFIEYYFDTVNNQTLGVQRRKSTTAVHSDDNATLQEWFGEDNTHNRVYGIINYKWLPTISLNNTFYIEAQTGDYKIKWTAATQHNSSDSFAYDVEIWEVFWDNDANNFATKNNSIYKVKRGILGNECDLVSNLLTPDDRSFYKVKLSLSENTADSYYIGEEGASNSDEKVYQYLNVYEAPSGVKVESFNDETKKELNPSSVINGEQTITSNFDDQSKLEPENAQVVIINEDSNGEETLTISFDQKSTEVAYRLRVYNANKTEILSEFYVGKHPTKLIDDLFIYYVRGTNNIYADANASAADLIGVKNEEVVGSITNGKVVINKLTIAQLFTAANINKGGYYVLRISAFIPVSLLMESNHNAGINQDVNNFNDILDTNLIYYLKFKTPQVTNVSISGDIEIQGTGENQKTYILNNGGKYSYTLEFEISNLGTSSVDRSVAVMVEGHYNIEETYLVENIGHNFPENKTTVSIQISENLGGQFGKIVNTSLPASLKFVAVILPKADYTTLIGNFKNADLDPAIYVGNSYNLSNIYVANKTVNSLVNENGSSITLGIQLPNVPLQMFENRATTSNTTNIVAKTTNINNVYENKFQVQNYAGYGSVDIDAFIATDPYIGFRGSETRTRDYLYQKGGNDSLNNKFGRENGDSTSDFNFKVYAKRVEDNSYGDSIQTINIADVLKLYKAQTTSAVNNNLYTALKNKFATGGKIVVKFVLENTKTNQLDYIASEGTEFVMDFYVRDEAQYDLTLENEFNWENAQNVSYRVTKNDSTLKTDFVRPQLSGTFGIKEDNTITPAAKEAQFLVGLTHSGSSDRTYYFTTNNSNDVLAWVCDNYYSTNNLFENKYDPNNTFGASVVPVKDYWSATKVVDNDVNGFSTNGFIITTLTSGTWTITFTMLKSAEANNYTICNYVNSNNTTFESQLKLKNETSVSPTANDLDSDNNLTLNSSSVFYNVNTSAAYLNYCVQLAENTWSSWVEGTNSVPLIGEINLNQIYGNVLANLENDNNAVIALSKGIENVLKANGKEDVFGNYMVKFKYQYLDGFRVLDSDPNTSEHQFEYTYRQIVKNNFIVLSVINGEAQNEAKTQIDISNAPSNDGIVIISDSEVTNGEVSGFNVVLKLNNKVVEIPSSNIVPGTVNIGGVNRQYVFIAFDPNHADCLGTGTATENSKYLQPGTAYTVIITPNYLTEASPSSIYQFIHLGDSWPINQGALEDSQAEPKTYMTSYSETQLKVIKTVNNVSFKLDYVKYLGLSPANSIGNPVTCSPKLTKNNLLDDSEITSHKVCEKCEGLGYCAEPHSYQCIKTERKQNKGGKYTLKTYVCTNCGYRTTARNGNKPENSDDACYGKCSSCHGKGYKIDTVTCRINKALINVDGHDVLAWQPTISIADNTGYDYVPVQILVNDNGKAAFYSATLKSENSLQGFTVYTKYKLPVVWQYGGTILETVIPCSIKESTDENDKKKLQEGFNYRADYNIGVDGQLKYGGKDDDTAVTVCQEPSNTYSECFTTATSEGGYTCGTNNPSEKYHHVKINDGLSNVSGGIQLANDLKKIENPIEFTNNSGYGQREAWESNVRAEFRFSVVNNTAFDFELTAVPSDNGRNRDNTLRATFDGEWWTINSNSVVMDLEHESRTGISLSKYNRRNIEFIHHENGSAAEAFNDVHFSGIYGNFCLYIKRVTSYGNVGSFPIGKLLMAEKEVKESEIQHKDKQWIMN